MHLKGPIEISGRSGADMDDMVRLLRPPKWADVVPDEVLEAVAVGSLAGSSVDVAAAVAAPIPIGDDTGAGAGDGGAASSASAV